jgi:uncharacterized membrane protein
MKIDPLPRFIQMDRTVALSDAVFGVVMTLLVLGIEVPPEDVLARSDFSWLTGKLGHQVVVYFVSFWLVAMYWSQHILFFSALQSADRPLVVLSLMFLLPVTLLPFVTQLMGSRGSDWRFVLVFALTNLLTVFVLSRMWKHGAEKSELRKGPETLVMARRASIGIRYFVGVTIVGVLTSLVDVSLGIFCFVLMPVAHFYNLVVDLFGSEEEAMLSDEPPTG